MFYIMLSFCSEFSFSKMTWVKQEDKGSIGCSQFPSLTGPPIYRRESLGSEASWNAAQTQSTFTGKSLWAQARRRLSEESRQSSETPATPNYPDQKPVPLMYGRKTPESPAPSLNLENSPSSETAPQTGTEYGNTLNEEISCPFQQMFVFTVTGLCEQSALTTQNRLVWSGLAMYTSVRLELGSLDALGMNPEWRLIVRIPTVNSGAATLVNHELSLMNFVVESMSHTYSDGSIVIRSMWKSRDQVSHYVLTPFGSQPTWTLNNGTPNWTLRH